MSSDVGGHKGPLSFSKSKPVGNDDGTWRTLGQCYFIGEISPKRKNSDFEVFYLLDMSKTKGKIVKYIYLIFNV
jgi:hypothetical protein